MRRALAPTVKKEKTKEVNVVIEAQSMKDYKNTRFNQRLRSH